MEESRNGVKRIVVAGGGFARWLWRTIYLMKLLSWRKKFKVAIDWTFDLFVPRDVSQI